MPRKTDAAQGESVVSDQAHKSSDNICDYNTPGWAVWQRDRAGKLSHGCIAWMLGLPLPIIILAFLWRGCD